MANSVKNFILGTITSLGKFQENIGQNINGIDDNITIQQEVQKHELKLVSKSRFYDLLEGSEIISRMKKLGIPLTTENIEKFKKRPPTGFKNERYGAIMETINGDENTARYKFRANNKIYMYASNVNFIYNNDKTYLEFIINIKEHPYVIGMDFSNLNYFEVTEMAKSYSYNITEYIGGIKINEFENGYIFQGEVDMNGVYDFDMDDKNVILDSINTPPHTLYVYNGNL